MAFHPEPQAEMIQAVCGWVRVIPSNKTGYQMNSGEFVEI